MTAVSVSLLYIAHSKSAARLSHQWSGGGLSSSGRMGNYIRSHSKMGRPRRGHTGSHSRCMSSSSMLRTRQEVTRCTSMDGISSLTVKHQPRATLDSQKESSPPDLNSLRFLAITDHSPCGYGDISLLQGEAILVHGRMAESGWWYGESVVTGECGYIPSAAVAPLERLQSLE